MCYNNIVSKGTQGYLSVVLDRGAKMSSLQVVVSGMDLMFFGRYEIRR